MTKRRPTKKKSKSQLRKKLTGGVKNLVRKRKAQK